MTLYDLLLERHPELNSEPAVVDITDCCRMFTDGTLPPADAIIRAPWPNAFYEFNYRVPGTREGRLGVHLFTMPDHDRVREMLADLNEHTASLDLPSFIPPGLLRDDDSIDEYQFGTVYLQRKGDRPGIEMIVAFAVNHTGELDQDTLYHRSGENRDRETTNDEVRAVLAPVFLAVHLLHCKNVGTVDHRPEPKVAAKRVRRGKPPGVTFKTLVVNVPGTKTPVRLYPPGEPQNHNARHVVRGHFKTYTKDKPLLGRHWGTFFFVQHVRGRDHTREIVKEYALEKENS